MNGPSDNACDPRKLFAGVAFDPRKVFAGLRCWVVTDGKAGDETPCIGLAQAMGLKPERRVVKPRALFALLSPRGPVDPAERPGAPGSPIAPPFPDILIASGRRAVPYLRHVRRASGGKTFTVFLKNPRVGTGVADVIWAPTHDGISGDNVVVSAAAPHLVSPAALAAARTAPDPRIAALPHPRMALLLGGASRHHSFEEKDRKSLAGVVESMLLARASVMITPSRRTPSSVLDAFAPLIRQYPGRVFLWDGTGDNPYLQMLAHAKTIVVTGDSTNMVGEAVATDARVMIYEPTGGHYKISAFIDALEKAGRVRRWRGRLEEWPCAPLDATQDVAAEVAARFFAWRGPMAEGA